MLYTTFISSIGSGLVKALEQTDRAPRLEQARGPAAALRPHMNNNKWIEAVFESVRSCIIS